MNTTLKKKLSLAAIVISAPLIFTSCGETKTTDPASTSEQATTPYPLKVCIVSGEELGSMGEPHVFVHNGQEIKMCCDRCMPKFNKNPDKYLAKLKQGNSGNEAHDDHNSHNH